MGFAIADQTISKDDRESAIGLGSGPERRALHGFFRTMLSFSAPFAASFRNYVAEAVNVPEHLFEVFRRALQLSPITFPVKDAHRVFDGKEVVEELRDRLTQLRCFRSSCRRCKHVQNMGTNTVLFKANGLPGKEGTRPCVFRV
jgi:hypothetical protein